MGFALAQRTTPGNLGLLSEEVFAPARLEGTILPRRLLGAALVESGA